MKIGPLLPLIVLALSSLSQRDVYAQSKEYTPLHPTAADTFAKASIITEVLPSRSVTFRLKAPDARQVSVLVGFSNPPAAMAPSYQLKKDDDGLWSATVGPLAPDLYEVQFNVDGLVIADPGSSMPKPQRQVNTSLLEIPGDPPTFLDTRDVAHGAIRAEVYRSKVLNVTRPLLVYTPPGYDQRPQESYPVLFLYHGYGDTVYSWVTEGRVQQILDNAIAGRISNGLLRVCSSRSVLRPWCLQCRDIGRTSTSRAGAPNTRQNHREYPLSLRHNRQQGSGNGPADQRFIERLDQLKIPYAFEQYPDQSHSMEVWRPFLNKFIAKLFH
jgi:Carbohydrate-binding module 48 (Isoamylase N-terminal domain)